jgi:hypothetical protein
MPVYPGANQPCRLLQCTGEGWHIPGHILPTRYLVPMNVPTANHDRAAYDQRKTRREEINSALPPSVPSIDVREQLCMGKTATENGS